MNVITSPASSAFMVIASSLPAHFNILAYMRSKASTTRRAPFKNSLLVPPVDKHLARLYRPSRPPPRRSARPTPRIHFPRIYPPPMPHPRRAQTRARRPERARSPPSHRPRTTTIVQSPCTQNTRRATHHIRQIHPHRQRTIASKMFEPIGVQLQRHERDVGRIHGLEFKPIHRVRLKVCVGDEIFDRVEDFFKDGALVQASFEHYCRVRACVCVRVRRADV